MTDKIRRSPTTKKRPYQEPKLKIHGSLRTLTRGTMKGGCMDDGGGPKPNTRASGASG